MRNPYFDLATTYRDLMLQGQSLPLGGLSPPDRPRPPADAPRVLLFSPHPDDEGLTGALPLRLRDEGLNVINIAVTLGSRQEQRPERRAELEAACSYLGFDLLALRDGGLDGIDRILREQPAQWRQSVRLVVDLLAAQRPRAVFLPHESDRHPAHITTHCLVIDALKEAGESLHGIHVIETEYWAPMQRPNLLVESSAEDVAELMAALSCHAGEMRRSPYHLTLPAWMQDNVRRGGEIIGGKGKAAPPFAFGTLYRLCLWNGHRLRNPFPQGKVLSRRESTRRLIDQN